MIEIYLLEQLTAFADCGTLRAAAEQLHITQPALSRSMKKLEDEFGVSLFHRGNSKISLNETGKIAAEYARQVLAADQHMIDRVLFFDRSLRTICIGTCTPLSHVGTDADTSGRLSRHGDHLRDDRGCKQHDIPWLQYPRQSIGAYPGSGCACHLLYCLPFLRKEALRLYLQFCQGIVLRKK